MTQNPECALRNVHGLIANALQVVVDAGNRKYEAKIAAINWCNANS